MTTRTGKVVFTATGTKDAGKVAHTLMGAGAARKGFFFAGLQQAVENAEDAGASEFYIYIDRRNKTIRIVDNGGGFLNDNICGFFSLMVSPKAGKAGLIGRNGSGRYFLLHFCERLRVFTKSSEPDFGGEIVTFSLARADVEELISKDSIQRPVTTCDKPEFWDLPDTGSVIVLEGIPDDVWKRIPSNRVIVRDFGKQLKPSIARKIYINGQPLQPRPVIGDIIEETFDEVDGLPGSNSIYLFIPEARKGGEEVGLGAFNNVTTLKEVVTQMPEALRDLVPTELTQGRVLGDIYVPALNQFRAHDGRSFSDELFTSPVLDSLALFLDSVVRPLIDRVFEERQAEQDLVAQRAAVDSLCTTFRESWEVTEDDLAGPVEETGDGEDTGTDTESGTESDGDDSGNGDGDDEEEVVTVTPLAPVLLPGSAITIKATGKSKLMGNLLWEAGESGGKVSRKRGQETVYTAGKTPGVFTLVARHPKKAELYRHVKIRIVPDLALSVSPVKTEIIAGESHVFRARHIERTKSGSAEKLSWQVQTLTGEPVKRIKLSTSTGAKVTVIVDEKAEPGDYKIVCWDSTNPDDRAQSTFEVMEPPQEVGNFIKIEDEIYEVVAATERKHSPVELGASRISLTSPDDRHPTLVLDLNHEILSGHTPGSPGFVQVLIPYVITAHLEHLDATGNETGLNDPASIRSRMSALHQRLLLTANGGD